MFDPRDLSIGTAKKRRIFYFMALNQTFAAEWRLFFPGII
jgi:hypothetical protein